MPSVKIPRWRIWIRVSSLVLTVVVLLAGSASAASIFFIRHRSESLTLSTPIHRLEVTSNDGDIVVRTGAPGAPTQIRSRVTDAFRSGRYTEAVSAGVLRVRGFCSGGLIIADACAVNLDLVVAPGTAVRVNSRNGDATVIGATGPVEVTLVQGDIRVAQVPATARLNTREGNVRGQGLTAPTLSARSRNGNIRLDFAAAPVDLQAITTNGDVRIGVPDSRDGYRVQASARLGDRSVTVPQDARSGRSITVKSSTGDVHVSSE